MALSGRNGSNPALGIDRPVAQPDIQPMVETGVLHPLAPHGPRQPGPVAQVLPILLLTDEFQQSCREFLDGRRNGDGGTGI